AEDGIRDRNVTGVQTCALPIFRSMRLLRQHGGPSTWHRVHQDRTCPSQVRSSEADSRRMDRMASPERRRLPLAVDGSGLERASHHVHNTKTRHTPTRCTHHTTPPPCIYVQSIRKVE